MKKSSKKRVEFAEPVAHVAVVAKVPPRKRLISILVSSECTQMLHAHSQTDALLHTTLSVCFDTIFCCPYRLYLPALVRYPRRLQIPRFIAVPTHLAQCANLFRAFPMSLAWTRTLLSCRSCPTGVSFPCLKRQLSFHHRPQMTFAAQRRMSHRANANAVHKKFGHFQSPAAGPPKCRAIRLRCVQVQRDALHRQATGL